MRGDGDEVDVHPKIPEKSVSERGWRSAGELR